MRERLLPSLLLLTLLDLAFVQATGIVSGRELLPLWLLTLAAPWLRRLQRWRACRIAWNGGVLLVFALLVRHATTTGLLHMLEDGLVLAVLCQVHLLNNIGERQRPDLVFFNSLLVAFVTSFFAPDLVWSLLFGVHAFALVAALQVNLLVRRGGADDPRLVRRVVRGSLVHTTAILLVTGAAFVALPRDFARQGWLGEALAPPGGAETGLAERIRLDEQGPVQLGERVVAQIQARDGPGAVPARWRAIAFSVFDGVTWYPQDASSLGSRFATDPAWDVGRDGSWRRAGARGRGAARRLQVRLHDLRAGRLPLPLGAVRLVPQHSDGLLLDPRSFGGFVVLASEDAAGEPFAFDVEFEPNALAVPIAPGTRRHFVALPDRGVPQVARALARQLRSALPPDADVGTTARAASDWLQANRRYALPGEPGFARNLGEFLLGSGAGHCEYFATALALLLRLQDVPCRVVGGWLAHEVDAANATVLVRSRDAHAWVEALADDGRWLELDATPAADLAARRTEAASWWSETRRSLEELWSLVVGFDRTRRDEWLERLAALPAALLRPSGGLPLLGALALLLLFAYRRRRRQHEPAIVAFERAVRAAGLSRQDGETPRELLHRAAANGLEPARLQRLQAAAARHERLRYGPQNPAPDGAAR